MLMYVQLRLKSLFKQRITGQSSTNLDVCVAGLNFLEVPCFLHFETYYLRCNKNHNSSKIVARKNISKPIYEFIMCQLRCFSWFDV